MLASLKCIHFRSSGKRITLSFFGTLPSGNGKLGNHKHEFFQTLNGGGGWLEIHAKAVKNEMGD